jgi:ATPase subunit of ABC transporter with duplicated ATPase domains
MASQAGTSTRERDLLHPEDANEEEMQRTEQELRARLEAEAKAKADAEARQKALRNLPEAERLEAVLKENQELYGSVSQMRQELNALKLKGNTTERVVVPSEKPQYQHNKPTVFTGDGKYDVRTFIRAVERYLEGTKCPESERLSVAVSYLDGKARDFWDSREQLLKMSEQVNGESEHVLTMEHFTKSLIGAFGGLDPITQAWNEYSL